MAAVRQRRCPEGYGVRSLRLMRAAKERGMHLRTDGSLVLPTGKIHSSKPSWGRRRVNLSIDGETTVVQAARIICFLAHGEPPTASCVADHIDGDTLNDHPSNLRWATYSENTRNAHYSRNKTWEQKAIEACAGMSDPEAELASRVEQCKRHILHIGELTTERDALRAERDALKAALIAMRDWFGVDPQAKSQLDQWEDLAEEFYRETGFLRPGKDYPAAAGNPEEREEQRNTAWRIWADVKKGKLLAQVRAALARSKS